MKKNIYGYKFCDCSCCRIKCGENFWLDKNDIKNFVPVSKIRRVGELLHIFACLTHSFVDEDTLEQLIINKREYIVRYTINLAQAGKIKEFCYSSIAQELCSSSIDLSYTYSKKKSYMYDIMKDILFLFFGDPNDRKNLLRREWSNYLQEEINKIFLEIEQDDSKERNPKIHNTTKEFKMKSIGVCELCGADVPETMLLVHIKDWSKCKHSKEERRDSYNTLLLCANHDRIFSRGLITFDEEGNIIISKRLKEHQIKKYELDKYTKIDLLEGSKKYMEYHRNLHFKNLLRG